MFYADIGAEIPYLVASIWPRCLSMWTMSDRNYC